jgi:hypothetical protein
MMPSLPIDPEEDACCSNTAEIREILARIDPIPMNGNCCASNDNSLQDSARDNFADMYHSLKHEVFME